MGKLKKGKHNHLLTDILKFAIFSIVMLAPFLAVLSKCMYVTFNKNAYESYAGTIKYQQNIPIEKPSDLLEGKTYDIHIINNVSSQTNNASYRIGFSDFTLKDYLLDNDYTIFENAVYFTIGGAVGYTSNSCFAWYDSNLTYLGRTQLPLDNEIVNNLKFVFTTLNTDSPAFFNDTFKELIEVSNNILIYDNKLNNVFEYSVNQLSQMQLFNWTTNTAIYTPIEATTQGLGFDPKNNTLAILLTYWTLNTAIYIIFDIVIYCFTKLTHWTQE